MVLYAQADLAKQDGTKADIGSGVYSHHLIMTDVGHPMVAPPVMVMCPNGRPGSMMPPLMPSPKKSGSAAAAAGASGGHGHMKRQAPASGGGLSGLLGALGTDSRKKGFWTCVLTFRQAVCWEVESPAAVGRASIWAK
jgi:hypothetical protein